MIGYSALPLHDLIDVLPHHVLIDDGNSPKHLYSNLANLHLNLSPPPSGQTSNPNPNPNPNPQGKLATLTLTLTLRAN